MLGNHYQIGQLGANEGPMFETEVYTLHQTSELVHIQTDIKVVQPTHSKCLTKLPDHNTHAYIRS